MGTVAQGPDLVWETGRGLAEEVTAKLNSGRGRVYAGWKDRGGRSRERGTPAEGTAHEQTLQETMGCGGSGVECQEWTRVEN